MALSGTKKTVGTSAVSLNPAGAGWTSYGKRVVADIPTQTTGAAAVYVGATGVTTTAYGYKIAAGGEKVIRTSDELFAISTATGNDCFVLAATVA